MNRLSSFSQHVCCLLGAFALGLFVSTLTPGCGGSDAPSTGGSSSNLKKLGDSCSCGGSSTAAKCRSSSGPCQPQLTCFEVGGDGDCTKECSSDSDCDSGFDCVTRTINGVSQGKWCTS